MMQYRREVDGLRALAVVPVILYHAGVPAFSGGYVGVDVFFVISGYLITSIILAEQHDGTFTIGRFYERRARRILPALFAVLLCCLPFAWLWLLPDDFEGFADSVVAVVTFCSNILFWRASGGYFDATADLKPLLHTWSLAVEEQYYVLFPLFITLTWRLKRRRVMLLLGLIALASLLIAQWASLARPRAAFFLLPTRCWELLIGALIAGYFDQLASTAVPRDEDRRPGLFDELASMLGLLMIACAVFVYDESTPFPGFYALIPTIGAGLIILFATERTWLGRLLGNPLPVGIGLISYSLYLWHQPILAFARHRSLLEPNRLMLVILGLGAAFPAYLTWRYVERPFRKRGVYTRGQIFSAALAVSLVMASLGLAVKVNGGFPQRLDAEVIKRAKSNQDEDAKYASCHSLPRALIAPAQSCVLGDRSKVNGLLIGDSHAEILEAAFDEALRTRRQGFRQLTMAGCPPLFDVYSSTAGIDCFRHNEQVGDFVESDKTTDTIVIAVRWTKWLEGSSFDNAEGGVEHGTHMVVDEVSNGMLLRHSETERRSLIRQRYVESIERYLKTGKRIVLIYPVPEVGFNAPRYGAKLAMFDDSKRGPLNLTTSDVVYRARNRDAIEVLDSIGPHDNLIRIRPGSIFCDTFVRGRCAVALNGISFYADDNHLSTEGARLVVAEVMKQIDAERHQSDAASVAPANLASNGSM